MNARKLAAVFQFRFRTLFMAVAFVALAVTALLNATPLWSHDMYCLAIALLTLAIPLACYRRGEQRAFWAGFALCGWVYLLLVGTDWSANALLPRGPSESVPTSRLTLWIYKKAYGDPGGNHGQVTFDAVDVRYTEMALRELAKGNDASATFATAAAGGRPRPDWWYFLNVGHAIWTILIACLGGVIVRGIYILRPEEKY